MTISVGDRLPDAELRTMTADGPTVVKSGEVLGTGKVVLFAVPGAFTPGCSNIHLPGFVERADELKAKGVTTIACVAVNDPFVMDAWGKAHGVGDDIVLLADGNGEFTAAMGLELDGSGFGLGRRSKRYAAIVEDGVLTSLDVDEKGIDLSSCSNVLLKL
ncbi:peroxiredoxin [Pseudonocardia hierapolitana]|uniref:Glutathione-dependent peroxiredoxin n=1 Tax=Pseudonocardia hierapolitana TaxID=1128676 RepID=A0A561T5K7_9PSEU|nr:peroxiredoxin [Pseudonocardia hierapolitana]TWF82390.1 peroxiredoxin [Pseudonocardia hierapolitana]